MASPPERTRFCLLLEVRTWCNMALMPWALCLIDSLKLRACRLQVTAPMAPHWGDLRTKYVEPLLRGLERLAADPTGPAAELALVCFGAAVPFSACPLDRAGWTTDAALFRRWLDAVVPAGGGRQQTVLTGAPRVTLALLALWCSLLWQHCVPAQTSALMRSG